MPTGTSGGIASNDVNNLTVSDISTYLTQIEEASYGAQVRTAIHNAIAACYYDVVRGVTALEADLDDITTAVYNANTAVSNANSAASRANEAQDAYDQARYEYNQIVGTATTVTNNINYIADNVSSISQTVQSNKDSVASMLSLVTTYRNNAASSASIAQTYANQLDNIDSSLARLEQASTNINGWATTASSASEAASGYATNAYTYSRNAFTYASQASSHSSAAEEYYNNFVALNPTQLSNKIDAINQILEDPDNLRDRFDGYSTTFAGYAATFGQYATQFGQYSQTFSSDVETVNNAVDHVETLRDYCDDASDHIDAVFSQISQMEINSKYLSIMDAVDSVAASVERAEDMDIDAKLNTLSAIEENMTRTAQDVEDSVQDLSDSISAAMSAANYANSKVEELNILQGALSTIQSSWTDSVFPTIQSSISSANQVAMQAQAAAAAAASATDAVNSITSDAESIKIDLTLQRSQMSTYLASIEPQLDELNNATESIENMTVSAETVSYLIPSSATITDEDGHKNIHFAIQRGIPGPGNVIKGPAYSTLSELQQEVTSPEEGDQYNVGSSAPYNVYRWTGDEWEDEGPYGVTVDRISDNEIDAVYDNDIYDPGHKYLDINGLAYYTRTRLKGELDKKVSIVSGKTLSTNDFTNEYKTKVDNNQASITTLDNLKVDKIAGKGLSTNDFTNALKTQISVNASDIVAFRNNIATLSEARAYLSIS